MKPNFFLSFLRQKISFNKREKIIISAVILSLGLLSTRFVPFYFRYQYIAGLSTLAYLLSLWSLWEGMSRLKAGILLILPTLFMLAVSSYYFLLLQLWGRLLAALLFGLVFYTLLLSQNIFNVSAIRTIPLYRVASTVIFVLTLITAFLLFNVIYSMDLFFVWNGIGVTLVSFLLILPIIWSIKMEGLSAFIVAHSLILALIVGEVGTSLSFWPIFKPIASLVTSTMLFITLGLSTHSLRDRLSRGVVWEYIGWGVVIFLVAAFTTSWTG